MPNQDFNLYTAKGYAGELCDSAPVVTQSGIAENDIAFGVALSRGTEAKQVDSIVPASGAVFGIARREYNHEAATRPSDGTTNYKETETVSVLREGFIYIELGGNVDIEEGQVLHVDRTTGVFSKLNVAGNVVACTNVTAQEDGVAGDIIKARIDITAAAA